MTPKDKSSKVIVEVDFRPGNLGNKMLQYMAAVKLCDRIGSERISNVSIPEFGVEIAKNTEKVQPFRLLRYHSKVTARLDFDRIAEIVAKGRIDKVVLSIYSSAIDNLPPLDMSRHLFPLKEGVSGYGDDVLLINVRAAEILDAVHKEYTVIPVDFYKEIVSETGLRPVFLGQLGGEGQYLKCLKDAFPDAEFVPSQGALHDFSVIAKSRNIVIAVSTFSWLAGWLSGADRVIMPLSGFLNPLQYPQVDLVPSADRRFSCYLFPRNYAVKDADILEAHKALKGTWRKIDDEEMKSIKSRSQVKPISPSSTLHFLARSGARYFSFSPRRLLRKLHR